MVVNGMFITEADRPTQVKAACDELGVKILAYSPLAQGALTGKYRSVSFVFEVAMEHVMSMMMMKTKTVMAMVMAMVMVMASMRDNHDAR